jgi:hypothetical protein
MPSALRFLSFGSFRESTTLPWYRAMERAFKEIGLDAELQPRNRFSMTLAKVAAKLGLVRSLLRRTKYSYLVPVMHVEEYRYFPRSYWSEIIPFCFDCWPKRWDDWEATFRRNRVRIAFFTAKEACREFSTRLPEMKCFWVPEGTDVNEWNAQIPLASRAIDVLELGRRYDPWHFAVVESLIQKQKKHLYEKIKGEIVFSTRRGLAEGYASSKMSVCFPQSLTHPERAGTVETTTMRYFEAMASKCIVFGKSPRELIEDFGYDPVVQADMNQPVEQLFEILSNLEHYADLVEQNFLKVIEHSTWIARFRQVLRILAHEKRFLLPPLSQSVVA